MPKSLIIVESPAKARTIEKFLGRGYSVKASMGHVRDLPKSQFGVDVENGFEPKYITIRGKGAIVKELKDASKKAIKSQGKVYLATDPDREGEAISWHLAQALGLSEENTVRVEFHEITKDAVRRALKQPRPIHDHLVEAQQARRVLDRVVGYKLSPLLWRKVRPGLSAGRVQSVAVRLICDREDEINAFVPEEYWTIAAHVQADQAGTVFQASYYGRDGQKQPLPNEAAVEQVLAKATGATFRVGTVRRRERRRNPALPFTTSSLQQEAARKLGYSVRKTMSVAQQLYEGLDLGKEGTAGLITYVRTDSSRVAAEAWDAALAYVTGAWGEDYAQPVKREEKDDPRVQGAHEAIRPTDVERSPDLVKEYLSRDQYRLYRLIWERFVASAMSPAVMDTVSADLDANGETFRATGSAIKFRGFMAVYIEGRDDGEAAEEDESFLPELTEGQTLDLQKLEPKQHFTQPPPRYSEAMLVKALEERGIGRPSTYAPIIETIQARGYVLKEERRFYSTDLGQTVVSLLKQYFPSIVDVEFTAGLEGELDAIEQGDAAWREVLGAFFTPFQENLDKAEEEIGGFEIPDEESDVDCDKCGRRMVIKHGRFGKFLACPGYPDCKNAKPILEDTGVTCPACGTGHIVGRRSKKGRRFFGCDRYPECNFVLWNEPVAQPCEKCNAAFMVAKRSKDRGNYLACATEGCDHTADLATDEED